MDFERFDGVRSENSNILYSKTLEKPWKTPSLRNLRTLCFEQKHLCQNRSIYAHQFHHEKTRMRGVNGFPFSEYEYVSMNEKFTSIRVKQFKVEIGVAEHSQIHQFKNDRKIPWCICSIVVQHTCLTVKW